MRNDNSPIDADALIMLGPRRLASVLADEALTHPSIRRQLEFEWSARQGDGTGNTVHAVRHWISELHGQTAFLGADEIRILATELDAIRIAIASVVSLTEKSPAADLMWQLFTLAPTVFERTTEDGFEVSEVFSRACGDLIRISIEAGVTPADFAPRLIDALIANDYGEFSDLIPAIASAPMPSPTYVSELRATLQELLNAHSEPQDGFFRKRVPVLLQALRELDSLLATSSG